MLNSLVRVSRRIEWNKAQPSQPKATAGETKPRAQKRASAEPVFHLQSLILPGSENGLAAYDHKDQKATNFPSLLELTEQLAVAAGGENHGSRRQQEATAERLSRKTARPKQPHPTLHLELRVPLNPRPLPFVYLRTISRTLELSLQSSFQLSLTVLVRYRSRRHI